MSAEKKLSENKHGEGCVLRKKLVIGSVRSQKHLTIPSQITLRINIYLEEPDGKIILKTTSYEELLKTARK